LDGLDLIEIFMPLAVIDNPFVYFLVKEESLELIEFYFRKY
jgi:hypothetical protein